MSVSTMSLCQVDQTPKNQSPIPQKKPRQVFSIETGVIWVMDIDRAHGFDWRTWSYSRQILANGNRHSCNRTKMLQVFSRNKHTTGLLIKDKRIILASLLLIYCLKLEKITLLTCTIVSQVQAEDNQFLKFRKNLGRFVYKIFMSRKFE